MKLVIADHEYELTRAMEEANLNDLYQMTLQTGVGMSTLGKNLSTVDTTDLESAMDDPKVFQALRCMIFLVKRFAGEKCTVESANAFPFSQFSFVAEESDTPAEVDEDPTPLPE